MKTKFANKTEVKTSAMGFGFFDKKGREIGMEVRSFECDFVEIPAGSTGTYYTIEPGHYFAAITQATRDGKGFGAGQRTHYFKTEEERSIYLAKRWNDSLKAAAAKGSK